MAANGRVSHPFRRRDAEESQSAPEHRSGGLREPQPGPGAVVRGLTGPRPRVDTGPRQRVPRGVDADGRGQVVEREDRTRPLAHPDRPAVRDQVDQLADQDLQVPVRVVAMFTKPGPAASALATPAAPLTSGAATVRAGRPADLARRRATLVE